MKRSDHRQQGQTIAVAAVVLVAIVGALAFVIDLGFQMETRRELQNAADAAALAGVVALPDNQCHAKVLAVGNPCDPGFQSPNFAGFAYTGANAANTDRICGPAVNLPDLNVQDPVTAPLAHPNVYSKATPGQQRSGSGYIYTLTVTMECN